MSEWEWLMSGWALAYVLCSILFVIICLAIVDHLDNRKGKR